MDSRYANLTKIPAVPVARRLAEANVHLSAPLAAPATAQAADVLAELERTGRVADALMLLAVLLPPRERVWWACLAARDITGQGAGAATASLRAAEAWVFKPTPENRAQAQSAIAHARVGDDTTHCAVAAVYADGTLGPGDLSHHPAPAGAAEMSVFAMNMLALAEKSDSFAAHARTLVDRALDIARGGNGRVSAPPDAPGGDGPGADARDKGN